MQREALERFGVSADNIYCDQGFSGANRARPGLDQALAALRNGDTIVLTALDRLARSIKDAQDIAETIEDKGAKLQIGSTIYDPEDPLSRMFFHLLAVFAEFERSLISQRTREGMAKARRQGKLRGRAPKLSELQQNEVVRMTGEERYSVTDIAKMFGVSRTTIYRTIGRKIGEAKS